jgi:hypothetical protein
MVGGIADPFAVHERGCGSEDDRLRLAESCRRRKKNTKSYHSVNRQSPLHDSVR